MKSFWNKRRILGVLLIFVAVGIATYIFIDNNVSSKKTIKSSKDENVVTEEVPAIETLPEEPEEPEEQTGSSGDFKVTGLNQEVLGFIDGKQNDLADSIRQYTIDYSYPGVTEAIFYGEVTINYTQNTVLVNVYLNNDEYTKLEVIYDKRNGTFTTQPW